MGQNQTLGQTIRKLMGNQRGRLTIRRPGGEGEVVGGGGGGGHFWLSRCICFTSSGVQQHLASNFSISTQFFFPEVHFAFYALAHCEDFLKEFLVFKIGSLCLVFQPTPSLYQRFAPY